MANTIESKLMQHYGITAEQADALVKAGLRYPHEIKVAKKADLEKALGETAAADVIAQLPKAA